MKQDQGPGAQKGEAAVVKLAAAREPASRRRSAKVNGQPIQSSSSQVGTTASPAFQEPFTRKVRRLLLRIRLAATVLTTMPIAAAGNVRRPNTIKFPATAPVAGQSIATPKDAEIKANPNRAARKYAMAVAPAALSAVIHPRAPVA